MKDVQGMAGLDRQALDGDERIWPPGKGNLLDADIDAILQQLTALKNNSF